MFAQHCHTNALFVQADNTDDQLTKVHSVSTVYKTIYIYYTKVSYKRIENLYRMTHIYNQL